MGCAASSRSSQPPARQELTLARLVQWWPQLSSRVTRTEFCVGQPPGDAPPEGLIVNGVYELMFADSEEGDEIML
jgi:hypothetical protein